MTTRVIDENCANIEHSKLTGTSPFVFDDNKMVNDISTLALRQASNENKVAYDTASMYVDVFQDATGITGLTNATRSASEYVSSSTAGADTYWNYASGTSQLLTASGGNHWTNSDWWQEISQGDQPTSYHTIGYWVNMTTNPGFANDWFYVDYLAEYQWSGLKVAFQAYHSVVKDWRLEYSNDGTNWTVMPQTGTTTAAWTGQSFVSGHDNIASVSDAANGVFTNSNPGSGSSTGGGIITFGTAVTARYLKLAVNNIHLNLNDPTAGAYAFIPEYQPLTTNATGSFTSNNITSSLSTSSMGAVVTYQDNAGTNALNSDIVMKLSADGGSNYATATLTAMPDFSSGIKMAKVNDLAVTAGTSLKYKLEFANQASGSKEARIRGVALQY